MIYCLPKRLGSPFQSPSRTRDIAPSFGKLSSAFLRTPISENVDGYDQLRRNTYNTRNNKDSLDLAIERLENQINGGNYEDDENYDNVGLPGHNPAIAKSLSSFLKPHMKLNRTISEMSAASCGPLSADFLKTPDVDDDELELKIASMKVTIPEETRESSYSVHQNNDMGSPPVKIIIIRVNM
eukprot:UN34689